LHLTHRFIASSGVLTALLPIFGSGMPMLASRAARAGEQDRNWRHGLSLFGELKYPPGFKYFDYVNPGAPKLGTVRMMALGTFDNFNEVIAGAKGSLARGVRVICDTLLAPSLDEAATDYGLIAEAVRYPDDFASATFRLRAGARHHDGKPITVEDVIFSRGAIGNRATRRIVRDCTHPAGNGDDQPAFAAGDVIQKSLDVVALSAQCQGCSCRARDESM
jgi:microcin C transport system substrate-binding protein